MAHILLADDDTEDCFLMSQTFSELEQSHILSCVEDGRLVIEFLENNAKEPVTLIVLDLNMPRVNGTEALKLLKSHPVFNNIPVIIFSTSVNEIEKTLALELGAESYLIKPTTYTAYLDICKLFARYSADSNLKPSHPTIQ